MRQLITVICGILLASSVGNAAETGRTPFPEFTVPLLGSKAESINRATLDRKVTYVDFWASWCIPCRESFPWLDAIQRKYQARGFQVIGVNKDQEVPEIERFLKRYPVGFTLTTDPGDLLAKALRVTVMPTGVLVDRQGQVRSIHRGFRSDDKAKLESEILTLLEQP